MNPKEAASDTKIKYEYCTFFLNRDYPPTTYNNIEIVNSNYKIFMIF